MLDLFVFSVPRTGAPGRQSAEREVSKDKVTYPLDEEGDNLNSYGEEEKKKENIFSCAAGSLDAGNIFFFIFFFLRGEKEPGESQRRPRGSKKIRRNREDESAFYASVFPSILCLELNK